MEETYEAALTFLLYGSSVNERVGGTGLRGYERRNAVSPVAPKIALITDVRDWAWSHGAVMQLALGISSTGGVEVSHGDLPLTNLYTGLFI